MILVSEVNPISTSSVSDFDRIYQQKFRSQKAAGRRQKAEVRSNKVNAVTARLSGIENVKSSLGSC
ncbi:MAG: hypothetical protein ACRC62_09780 [Microcoleus sp.]